MKDDILDKTTNDTMSKLNDLIKSFFYHIYLYMVLTKVTESVSIKKNVVKEITDDFIFVVSEFLEIIHRLTKLIMVDKTKNVGIHQIEILTQYHPLTVNKRKPFEMVWMSDG